MTDETKLILIDRIEPLIHEVRGQKVMLDSDLAKLYGVETKALNRAVKRNLDRFPSDFLMQLTAAEFDSLRYQFGTLKTGRGQHRKYLPYAFTEHGAFILHAVQPETFCRGGTLARSASEGGGCGPSLARRANVSFGRVEYRAASLLNSPRAVEVSVFVVRAFVKLRQLVLGHKDLADKLDQLERKVAGHDETLQQLVAAIRQLMSPPDPSKNRMGFHAIRDSAQQKGEPPDRTASATSPKRRRRPDD